MEAPSFVFFMELIIKQVNFIPYQDNKSKGFLGFLNIILGNEKEDLISLSSYGVYTKLDSPNHIRLTQPARKLATGLKFYHQILKKELEDKIVEATEKELKRLNYFSTEDIEISESSEKNEKNQN